MKKLLIIITFLLALSGCKAEIGDDCAYDVDCSPDGDRTCDNNQPGGYCLIITCTPDQCPEEAACAEFITPSPEFDATSDSDTDQGSSALYEQLTPNRTRTYCLKHCKKDGDCRSGYHCAIDDELELDLNASVIDSSHPNRGICVPGNKSDFEDDSDSTE